jgi:polyphosphate kinase 2
MIGAAMNFGTPSPGRDWLQRELADTLDEDFELDLEDAILSEEIERIYRREHPDTIDRQVYFRELLRLQSELIRLQSWVQYHKEKVVVLFEGRDSAGKGGVIKRITQRLNPRVARTVALPAPSDREKTQWYFQRYVPHLPAGGEIVLFDRSWYNRAGVERVMGFADEDQVEQFFRDVPEFERMLVRSGIRLVKYWFSITDEEQQMRFLMRIHDPMKQWKLSPMDLQSRVRWEQYTKAKEDMFARTNIPEAPWYIVEGNDKKRARLNCIDHLLGLFPYEDVPHEEITLPDRVFNPDYERAVLPAELYVPQKY